MTELRLWPTATAPDLTLATTEMSPHTTWNPINQSCGSEHLPILISLGVKYSATGTSNKSRWKLTKADWGLFKTILFYSILSHNLGRSSGHHRWIRNNPFPSWPVFSCPSKAGKVHSCPLFDIVTPPLLLSASFSFSFHCALKDCLC